jgi:hypothetical protein
MATVVPSRGGCGWPGRCSRRCAARCRRRFRWGSGSAADEFLPGGLVVDHMIDIVGQLRDEFDLGFSGAT